ncbi:hypothetical protein [Gordonia sp. NPDC003429]
MRTSTSARRLLMLVACAVGLTAVSACGSDTASGDDTPTSVPRSAAVTVAPGAPVRTPPGTTLDFGATATLPADTYRAVGQQALFTVTGITPGKGVPAAQTRGGTAYFVYITVTSLAPRPVPAPELTGFAGSGDGHTPALTLPPSTALSDCPSPTPPKTMRRGDSYASCLIAFADEGTTLRQVIYWADTTGDESLDYKQSPVVWRNPNQVTSSSPAASPPA